MSLAFDPAIRPPSEGPLEPENESRPLGRRLAGWIYAGARLAGMGVFLQVVLVWLSPIFPILEFATHTSLHTLFMAIIVLPILWLAGSRSLLVGTGSALLYLVFLTQPWWLLPSQSSRSPGLEGSGRTLQILCWNVLSVNRSFAEIKQVVRQVNPDVFVLIEVRPGLLEQLPWLTESYPILLERPGWGGAGIAVLSRVAGTQLVVEDFAFSPQPAIIATIPGQDQRTALQLVGLHTLSPIPLHRRAIRDRQIHALKEWSEKQTGAVCVCGDFNITPWTRPFQSLLDVGFVDSRWGVGNCATWPEVLGPLGIPIDHAISKGDCHVFDRAVLASGPGSDHRPIKFKIAF